MFPEDRHKKRVSHPGLGKYGEIPQSPTQPGIVIREQLLESKKGLEAGQSGITPQPVQSSLFHENAGTSPLGQKNLPLPLRAMTQCLPNPISSRIFPNQIGADSGILAACRAA